MQWDKSVSVRPYYGAVHDFVEHLRKARWVKFVYKELRRGSANGLADKVAITVIHNAQAACEQPVLEVISVGQSSCARGNGADQS